MLLRHGVMNDCESCFMAYVHIGQGRSSATRTGAQEANDFQRVDFLSLAMLRQAKQLSEVGGGYKCQPES